MREQILQTDLAKYAPVEWTGDNCSGWRPYGDAVLVLPDQASTKQGALGLIDVPDEVVERNSLASESGTLIAVGPGAFQRSTAHNGPLVGEPPQIGQRIMFERYAGRMLRGDDGQSYRMMEDVCVIAVRDNQGEGESNGG